MKLLSFNEGQAPIRCEDASLISPAGENIGAEHGMGRHIRDSQVTDYINLVFDTFLPLSGDRKSGDDNAVIGGLARLGEQKVVVVAYQMDWSGETPRAPGPEGYRKSSRLVHLAVAFNKPVILLIDVPLVPSSSKSDQQKVAEAIALNLEKMSCLMTPIIGVIVGESCGAAAIDMCAVDRVLMLGSASCSIPRLSKVSANGGTSTSSSLKVQDLLDLNVVHGAIKGLPDEDLASVASTLRESIVEELRQLMANPPELLVQQRLQRLQYQFRSFATLELPSGNAENTI